MIGFYAYFLFPEQKPGEKFLFKFQEKPELPEDKSDHQQKHIVNNQNHNDIKNHF